MSSHKSFPKIEIDSLWLLRIFTVIPVVLVLLTGAGMIWIYFFVLSLLPSGQSQVDLPGLSAAVKVVRDRRGVPGILGDNEDDVAMVLGYVMAQDRLWQMDFLRRASQGRLAEILGPEYLQGDHLMRTMRAGWPKPETAGDLGERERRWLDRFVRGINAYITHHAGKRPVEFSLLEYQPEPFTSNDVLGIPVALAWESSTAARVDPVMARILGKLGKERALEIFPSDPAASPGFVPSDLAGWTPEGFLFSRSGERRNLMRIPGFRGGCAWTAARTKTRSGNPMAGCMVYQALTAPAFWYRARLVAGDFILSGAFLPGVPLVLVGANQQVSWGCVSSPADDADLYVERLEEESGNRYWRVDRWKSLKEMTETYRVKGRSSVTKTMRFTDTGPVVSDVHDGRALSLRWAAREGLGFYPAYFALNRAANGKEIGKALKALGSPCLNVVWADVAGGCGLQLAGRIPVRPPGSDGVIPMPAWTGNHDWNGFIPFDELPSVTDPASGYAAVADGRPGGVDYPLFTTCYWNDDSRRERIRELLDQSGEHHRDTFMAIEKDVFSPLGRDLTPVILKALGGAKPEDPAATKAIELLSSWDFRMKSESPAAAVFALTYQALLDELFRKALGEKDYQAISDHYPLGARMAKRIFLQGQANWLGADQPEQVLARSFKLALKKGKSLMGGNPADWKWGAIHASVFVHPLTTRSRFLELLYQVGPVAMPGSGDTLDLAAWSKAHPFRVLGGVTLRQTADMTHPPEVFGISPLGVSSHFFSTHYKDQTTAWAKGLSFREPVEKSDIRQNAFDTVLFSPVRADKLSLHED